MRPTRLTSAVATALLLLTSSPAPAQFHSREPMNRELRTKFNNHDREAARKWYNENRGNLPQGFRDEDRSGPEEESRLQAGTTLDPGIRRRVRPVPMDLLRRLAPPPRHYRYAILNEHLLLVEDRTWNISDTIRLPGDDGHQG
jgi:Ni/Co efflux regulator RcnB